MKILLVEDNPISRQLMSDFLVAAGYDVVSVPEANSFSSVMDDFNPNLILLDLKLPGADGYTVLQRLRINPKWQNVPVIVVSAYAFTVDKQRALKLGARQYLVKPIKLKDLTDAIALEVAELMV